ncbi:MAG: DUF3798 domain-containing protein, partial [Lachnospiraceae bacterium]|nr:DUF3798 domain-containing protein [Lachnospiraceae bacterium]
MNKKLVSVLMAAVMAASLTACGGAGASVDQNADSVSESSADVQEADNVSGKVSQEESNEGSNEESNGEASGDNFRIGIVTGSYAQSEDDRRGAEAFRDKYGADRVTLAIYPDNFTEELEITIQTIVNLSEDPDMKAIIVNQAVDGTAEAFRRIKETRPDILCIAGEAYEDFADIEPVADLVVSSDFVARGYLMIRSAHELGC